MEDQLLELVQDLRDRSLTYQFLARTLSDEEVPVSLLDNLVADSPQTGTDLDGYVASLAGTDLEAARTDLAADHAALLLGMSRHPVSPYESVWTSEEELMMQDARDDAVARYAASGFGRDPEAHIPEDHISIELDFVAALGNRAADAIESANATTDPAELPGLIVMSERDMNAQVDFIETHLFNWVFRFADMLEEQAKTGFYRGVAQLLRGFLTEECTYIQQIKAAAEE